LTKPAFLWRIRSFFAKILVTGYKQNRVSQAVWRWQAEASVASEPARMNPRVKVLITTPIALLIAFCFYKIGGHTVGPSIVVAIALVICFCGLFVPAAFEKIDRFLSRFGVWVAKIVSWILLMPVFYLIFAPAHLLLALRKRDPMHRECPSQKKTYWTSRPPITRKNYYRTQH